MLGDGSGSDEADGANERVVEERIDRSFAAINEIDDAGGQAGFLDDFDEAGG